jgi:hypothetical protein
MLTTLTRYNNWLRENGTKGQQAGPLGLRYRDRIRREEKRKKASWGVCKL